jgi:hypothetical protein
VISENRTRISEAVEKVEPSYIIGGNIKVENDLAVVES